MPEIRPDFTRPTHLTPESFEWVPSPGGEVERVMLDRAGDEVAVATSLVRYPPGSRFPAHEHGGGEEYLVLEGEFADEHGRYGPGTYVRNPPGSRHSPFSDPGCVIWVKLRQFHPDDARQAVTDAFEPVPEEGVSCRELHRFEGEVVTALTAAAGVRVPLPPTDCVQELLVADGTVKWQENTLGPWGWIRVPAGRAIDVTVKAPARLLHKTRPAFALPGGGVTGATSAASAGT